MREIKEEIEKTKRIKKVSFSLKEIDNDECQVET